MPKMILPNKKWLKANGRGEMVKAMEANPEVFADIPREPDLVTERAIVARINRTLPEFERVHFNRRGAAGPRYRHVDAYNNALLGEFDDLESFAKECGVLTANEEITY
jgi:hypothetical protein